MANEATNKKKRGEKMAAKESSIVKANEEAIVIIAFFPLLIRKML